MLSWSSTQTTGTAADLAAITDGTGDGGLPNGAELVGFVEAIANFDEAALRSAREALVAATSEAFMVDAAAVTANFEMMTRVADGTGARFPDDPDGHRAPLNAALDIGNFTSAR